MFNLSYCRSKRQGLQFCEPDLILKVLKQVRPAPQHQKLLYQQEGKQNTLISLKTLNKGSVLLSYCKNSQILDLPTNINFVLFQ